MTSNPFRRPRPIRRLVTGSTAAMTVMVLTLAGCSATGEESTDVTSTTATSATTVSDDSAGITNTGETTSDSSEVVALAEAFMATLDEEQLASLQQDYSFENAQNWSNFPQALLAGGMGGGAPGGGGGDGTGEPPSGEPPSGEVPPGEAPDGAPDGGAAPSGGGPGASNSSGRVGLQIGSLDDEQKAALEDLLAAAMGSGENEGYDEIVAVLAADDYLDTIDSDGGYGSVNYYVAFLGTPSDDGTWELQFGGHHLAVSNTYTDGELAGATPSFRGTEPTGEFTYDGETYDPLTQETDAFTALLDSFSDAQLTEAASDQTDLLLGPGEDWAFPETSEGVAVSDLSEDQQALVLAAIETYVDDVADDEAAEIMEEYTSELDETYVSFSGTGDFTEVGDYIRIDGPSVWIELAMQNGVATSAPHIHSVWRDKTDDYGGLTA